MIMKLDEFFASKKVKMALIIWLPCLVLSAFSRLSPFLVGIGGIVQTVYTYAQAKVDHASLLAKELPK